MLRCAQHRLSTHMCEPEHGGGQEAGQVSRSESRLLLRKSGPLTSPTMWLCSQQLGTVSSTLGPGVGLRGNLSCMGRAHMLLCDIPG